MAIVADASVVVSWAFDEEASPLGAAAISVVRREGASVPALWWFEVRNALIMNERRGRLTPLVTSDFLQELSRLRIAIDPAPEAEEVLDFARRHRLTVYDASYLELAVRRRIPLATLDSALAQAARREGVALIGD